MSYMFKYIYIYMHVYVYMYMYVYVDIAVGHLQFGVFCGIYIHRTHLV